MTGLKMGPKHKGFPMTQSIHFDSREKKVLGLTPVRGPLCIMFENVCEKQV